MSKHYHEDARYFQISDKIKELSNGSFHTVLKPSKHNDYLDGIIHLLNMLSENWKERVLHIPFVKESKPSQYLQIFCITTNTHLHITQSSTFAKNMLQLPHLPVFSTQLLDYLIPENKDLLAEITAALKENPHLNYKVQLVFNHLNIPIAYDAHVQYSPENESFMFHFIGLRWHDPTVEFVPYTPSSSRLLQKKYIDLKIAEIYDYLSSITDYSEVSNAALCTQFRINEQQLKTRFKALYNTTVYQYQLELRMNRSKNLVMNTTNPFKNIAIAVGFTDYSNFRRNFKNFFGVSPRALRRQHQL